MKSLVCNVLGMVLGVTCLALILNRPAAADDEPVASEQQQVIVVKTDDGQSVQEQKHVIAVQVDGKQADVADALQKVLEGNLAGLPEEIQKKIRQKLKAVKETREGQQDMQVEVIAVAGKEITGDAAEKTVTVTVTAKDDQVVVNGKPMKISGRQGAKEGEFTIEVRADAETGEVKADVKKDGEKGRQIKRRKMMILSQDGEAKSLDRDIDVATQADGVAVAKSYVIYGDKPGVKEVTPDGAIQYEVTIVGDGDAPQADGVHKLHLRALKAKPGAGKPQVDVLTVTPGMPLPHAFHFQAPPLAKANVEVAKRLKGIESELKAIRKLLEEMQEHD